MIVQAEAIHPQFVQLGCGRQGLHHGTDCSVGPTGIEDRIVFIPPILCRKVDQASTLAHRVNIPASTKGNFPQTGQAIGHILPIPGGILLLKLCQRQFFLPLKPVTCAACYELAIHLPKAGQIQNIF